MPETDKPAKAALTKNPLGPTGKAVAETVERLRNEQNLTFAALSARLESLGRPIPPLGLRKIIAQTRRVDADDLVALAVALGVSPITLLMPVSTSVEDSVFLTGFDGELAAGVLWDWLRAGRALPRGGFLGDFFGRALPSWKLAELEDQWAQESARIRDAQDAEIARRRAARDSGQQVGDGHD